MKVTLFLMCSFALAVIQFTGTQGDLAGTPLTDDVASTIIGGACGSPTPGNCGGGACGTTTGTVSGGATQCSLVGTKCNSNCSIWAGSNGSCNGS